MTNEELQEAIARADAEYDMLKDTCHDQYDKIQELQDRIDSTINYIEKYKTDDYCDGMSAKQLLDILKGEKNE